MHAVYVVVGVEAPHCVECCVCLLVWFIPHCLACYVCAVCCGSTPLYCLLCLRWWVWFHPIVLPVMYVMVGVVSPVMLSALYLLVGVVAPTCAACYVCSR